MGDEVLQPLRIDVHEHRVAECWNEVNPQTTAVSLLRACVVLRQYCLLPLFGKVAEEDCRCSPVGGIVYRGQLFLEYPKRETLGGKLVSRAQDFTLPDPLHLPIRGNNVFTPPADPDWSRFPRRKTWPR